MGEKNSNVSALYTYATLTECTHFSAKMPVSKERRKEGSLFT